jgi:hypothetical protein
MNARYQYKQGDKVIIHSMGDGEEYEGEVNGTVTNFEDSPFPNIFIVKILSPKKGQFKDYQYSHFAITGACLKLK